MKGEVVVHIVPTTANYLRFLAYLVSVSYALVFLMPCLLRYVNMEICMTTYPSNS
jgi:hypothetical protein